MQNEVFKRMRQVKTMAAHHLIIKNNGIEVLRFYPVELLRVFDLKIPKRQDETISLVYSHSDCVVKLTATGPCVNIEAIALILKPLSRQRGHRFEIIVMPTGTKFEAAISLNNVDYLKRLILSFYPHIVQRNIYLGQNIYPSMTLQHFRILYSRHPQTRDVLFTASGEDDSASGDDEPLSTENLTHELSRVILAPHND
jgi:hypothetical protein